MSPTLADRLFVALQSVIPQHWFSARIYRLARLTWPPLKDLMIRAFIRHYRVDLSEALEPDPRAYTHFNAFFTRALKADARPLDPDPQAILCPVDGVISQIGTIEEGCLLQAKGRTYRVEELLALAPGEPHPFLGGRFVTLYLSPRDYHRIHMPLAGRLEQMVYAPGRLFSVNRATAALVPNLFARNERLICRFVTEAGPMAVILVGALIVGGLETVWAGEITPPHRGPEPERWDYPSEAQSIQLARGQELGRFHLGSTVILLLPAQSADLDSGWLAGSQVRVGQRLGLWRPAGAISR
ncbi:phosphatidylserine decarboxylase [Caldichromatium japonicum]|uniref:Phosphatidylserine decarboxylase proenzyme n=1 Tax=Caldichromatium japonicum TaxID=2699430 RepID=A0A6G7VBS5_9GAMM|nr:archaetidylserine decarboxylase [Caldichromatium japonicum]QIK37326.1 phosphatidylserine decarboxylase [Caldichromatium japonicum]